MRRLIGVMMMVLTLASVAQAPAQAQPSGAPSIYDTPINTRVGTFGEWGVNCDWFAPLQVPRCLVGSVLEEDGIKAVLFFYPFEGKWVVVATAEPKLQAVLRVDQGKPQQGLCNAGLCYFARELASGLNGTSKLAVLLSGAKNGKSAAFERDMRDFAKGLALTREWAERENAAHGRERGNGLTVTSGATPGAGAAGAAPGAPRGVSPPVAGAGNAPTAPRTPVSPLSPPGSNAGGADALPNEIGRHGEFQLFCYDKSARPGNRQCLLISGGAWDGEDITITYFPHKPPLLGAQYKPRAFTMTGRIDNGAPYLTKCNERATCFFDQPEFFAELQSGAQLTLELSAAGKRNLRTTIDLGELRQGTAMIDAWQAKPGNRR